MAIDIKPNVIECSYHRKLSSIRKDIRVHSLRVTCGVVVVYTMVVNDSCCRHHSSS